MMLAAHGRWPEAHEGGSTDMGGVMAEEFEGQDLSDAVFWGVDFSRARFRDANMTNVSISHAWLIDVDIDALVNHVTINGVDVTQYVNDHDPWYHCGRCFDLPNRTACVKRWTLSNSRGPQRSNAPSN